MKLRTLIAALLNLLFVPTAFCQEANSIIPTRILILLDGSGSMKQKLADGNEKFQDATELILRIMDSVYAINGNVEFSLRVFGHQQYVVEHNCIDTKNEVPFTKNNRAAMASRLKEITPSGVTPIAYSLNEAAVRDITDEEHIVYNIVLITDGIESCGGDVCAVMADLKKKKIFFKPHVVGLESEGSMKKEYECMGEYLKVSTAQDKANTTNAIVNAIKPTINITKLAYMKLLPEDVTGKIPESDKMKLAAICTPAPNCRTFEMQKIADAERSNKENAPAKPFKKDPNALQLQNGDTYSGQLGKTGDKIHRGVYTWANGEKYNGEYKDDRRSGTGIYQWPNGDRFEGEWKDDEAASGVLLLMMPADNQKRDTLFFEGKFMEGKMNGQGTAKTPAYKYNGNWKDNKRSGQGICFFPDGRSYEGEWLDDKMNGHGVCILKNGDRYEGDWKNSMKNGKANVTLANGNKYTADYIDDKVNGDVVYLYANGDHYEGGYRDNQMNGHGTYTWPNGDTYVGDWKNDLKNGHGIFSSKTGEQYDGNWVDDKQSGYGKSTWPSGNTYEGYWKDNLRDGQGTSNMKDGGKYTGAWAKGKMNGYGVYTKDGKKYEGIWKNDMFKGK